jgi:hypothetical protein
MFRASHNLKIRQGIVEFVPVPVMNDLVTAERSAKRTLNDKPVLGDVLSVSPNIFIALTNAESFGGSYSHWSRGAVLYDAPKMSVAESSRVLLPRTSFHFTNPVRIPQESGSPRRSVVPPPEIVNGAKSVTVVLSSASFDFAFSVLMPEQNEIDWTWRTMTSPSPIMKVAKRSGLNSPPTVSYAASQSSRGSNLAESGIPRHAPKHSTEGEERNCPA